MITGIQLLEIIFGISMLYFAYISYKRDELSKIDFIVWGLIFFGFIYAAIFPESFNILLQPLHVGRPLDLITIIGFMIIFGIMLYIHSITRKNQRKIEAIVKKLAIDEFNDKNDQ